MIFTLGHSTLTKEQFVQAARGIDVIVDVRSHPGSRHVPHFSRVEMEKWLPEFGIAYEWWPGLGGWTGRHAMLAGRFMQHDVDVLAYCQKKFPKHRIAAARENAHRPCWDNQGLHDFSWYMTLGEFGADMERLIFAFRARDSARAALVCAEAQWWRCHRSMLADYLTFREVECYHLPTKIPKHESKPRFQLHADHIGNRLQRYDPEILEVWRSWDSQEKANAST